MRNQKNLKWLLLVLALSVVAAWSPPAADAAARKHGENAKAAGAVATVFACRAFANEDPNLIRYGFLKSENLRGILVLANGMSIELERTQPGLLAYRFMRGPMLITEGTVDSATVQLAMTAGGPWGAELHCTMAKE